MISILMCASDSKQAMVDITVPLWLKQEGVPGDFEVVIACSDALKLPDDPRVIRAPLGMHNGQFDFVTSMNNALKATAASHMCLITQADMEVNNHNLIRNMLRQCEFGHMVSERFFKNGKRHSGLFCHMLLVSKRDLVAAGGWDAGYAGLISYEDNTLMANLLENGVLLDFLLQDEEFASHHIPHQTNYEDLSVLELIAKAKKVYESKHSVPLLQIFARQYILRKRRGDKIHWEKDMK